MYALYTPVLIVQALCVYHAYRNNAEQRWYWFILLLPLIGSLIYLHHHFYRRRTIDALSDGVKEVVHDHYKIEQLELALNSTENVTNRINLADAYVECNRFDEAIDLYMQSLQGFMHDDPVVRMKLLKANYLKGDFTSVIALGKELEREKSFLISEERTAYAWALHHTENSIAAANIFQSLDKSFTNYPQRLEYCKFLKQTNQTEKLKEKVSELLEEFHLMKGRERKTYKDVRREIKEFAEFKTA